MFFDNSRPDRKKKADKRNGVNRSALLTNSPIPPAKKYEMFTADEINYGGERTLAFDVESYANYFCVSFKCAATGKVICFEDSPKGYQINGFPVEQSVWISQLMFMFCRFRLVGFNSRTYDLPICFVALQGIRAPALMEITDEIINQEMQAYEVERKYCRNVPNVNHIDLIEVAPITASLKIYAGRLHCERMQDLPFPVFSTLTDEQIAVVRDYNVNDLDNTLLLWNYLQPQIGQRESLGLEYGLDLRSKSDAQIAETVIMNELAKIGVVATKPKIEPGWQFQYKVPDFIEFKTPQFKEALETVRNAVFVIGNSGSPLCPKEIEALRPRLGIGTYRLGIGGLHSSEESVSYKANDEVLLIDRDVASFYPYIILNLGLYPEHLGEAFLKVYRGIVNRRLEAKRNKNNVVSDGLKITINGTFGKLGSFYSKLYSPDLLIQVTITGQLSLLMLIEMIELASIPVVSANTDGIVMRCPKERYADLEAIVIIWEEKTGFLTEETRYKGLYSRDVNNYIAVKEDGSCKTKGVFSEKGSALNSVLSKNPESYICSYAVQEFLSKGIPLHETILNCRDLKKFVSVRTVKGGAEKDGVFLGKAIRWYYAIGETGTINYVISGNNVPKSEGAKPLMNLPEAFPNDIDFDHYINEATEILYKIGYYKKVENGSFF